MQSRGFSEEDARNRLANQVPEEQRLSIADVVFTNNGSIEEFEAQISLWWEHEIGTTPCVIYAFAWWAPGTSLLSTLLN